MPKMPILKKKSITSGVWNERPKTSGIMRAKPSHSLRRRSGWKPSHSLNQRSASIALGSARNSHTKKPPRKSPRLTGR